MLTDVRDFLFICFYRFLGRSALVAPLVAAFPLAIGYLTDHRRWTYGETFIATALSNSCILVFGTLAAYAFIITLVELDPWLSLRYENWRWDYEFLANFFTTGCVCILAYAVDGFMAYHHYYQWYPWQGFPLECDMSITLTFYWAPIAHLLLYMYLNCAENASYRSMFRYFRAIALFSPLLIYAVILDCTEDLLKTRLSFYLYDRAADLLAYIGCRWKILGELVIANLSNRINQDERGSRMPYAWLAAIALLAFDVGFRRCATCGAIASSAAIALQELQLAMQLLRSSGLSAKLIALERAASKESRLAAVMIKKAIMFAITIKRAQFSRRNYMSGLVNKRRSRVTRLIAGAAASLQRPTEALRKASSYVSGAVKRASSSLSSNKSTGFLTVLFHLSALIVVAVTVVAILL